MKIKILITVVCIIYGINVAELTYYDDARSSLTDYENGKSTGEISIETISSIATTAATTLPMKNGDSDVTDLRPLIVNESHPCVVSQDLTTVCEAVENYPEQEIKKIIDGNEILVLNITQAGTLNTRGNVGHGDPNCVKSIKSLFPKVLKTTNQNMVYIPNYQDYAQELVVVNCMGAGFGCMDNPPTSFVPSCIAVTSKQEIVAIDPNTGKPYRETVDVPSACKCELNSELFPKDLVVHNAIQTGNRTNSTGPTTKSTATTNSYPKYTVYQDTGKPPIWT